MNKEFEKHGRTVYVRDRGTEVFEVIGGFFKSDDFKIGFLVAILSVLIVIATLSVFALFKGIVPTKVGLPTFVGIIVSAWFITLLKE